MARPMGQPRLPIVGVIGSGTDRHEDLAGPLGTWLASEGVHLLTGGGAGVMESVSRAFHRIRDREGLVIGIVPGRIAADGYEPKRGYPNRWVEVPILTHLSLSGVRGADPLSRNHINVLSSDVLIALPGSHGTASEARLALRYARPIVAYLRCRDEIPGLPNDVRLEERLEGVRSFVRDTLRRLRPV